MHALTNLFHGHSTTKKDSPNYERGQAIIVIVFAMIGIIGMIALAVDGGRAFLERRNLQNAADATALGGAIARIRDPLGPWVATTYGIARNNGYDNNGLTNSVAIYSPPLSGTYDKETELEYVQVIITSTIPTYFGKVIGIKEITTTAEAISRTKNGEYGPILDGNALISLAPKSDCQDKRAFWVTGESTLDIVGGGVFINSNNPTCALTQSGNGSIRIDGGEIRVVGGVDIQKPKLLTPFPPVTGEGLAVSYPPPFLMPKLGCSQDAEVSLDGKSMTAGAWDGSEGTFPPEGVESLEPGIYCLGTDFIPKGDTILSGSNVVIKMDQGEFRLGGETEVQLTAPSTGDYAGLLLYMPIDNRSRITLNGKSKMRIRGTILAPGAEIHINGGSKDGYRSQIIGYTIKSDGTDNINILYDDKLNFDVYNMPQVQLIK